MAVAGTLQQRFGVMVLGYGMTETSSALPISYIDRPVRPGSARAVTLQPGARGQAAGCPGRCRRLRSRRLAVAMAAGVFSGCPARVHKPRAFIEPGYQFRRSGRPDAEGFLWIITGCQTSSSGARLQYRSAVIEEVLVPASGVALAVVVCQPDAYAGEVALWPMRSQPGASASPADLLPMCARADARAGGGYRCRCIWPFR